MLQDGLQARGYKVVRLNTYTTNTVEDLSPQNEKAVRSAKVVAIASPSALRAWVEIVGQEHAAATSVACIGESSSYLTLSLLACVSQDLQQPHRSHAQVRPAQI